MAAIEWGIEQKKHIEQSIYFTVTSYLSRCFSCSRIGKVRDPKNVRNGGESPSAQKRFLFILVGRMTIGIDYLGKDNVVLVVIVRNGNARTGPSEVRHGALDTKQVKFSTTGRIRF